MIGCKAKTADARSRLLLLFLYSLTTIVLILMSTVFFMLQAQKAEAKEVDCSPIIDQVKKLSCIETNKTHHDHTKDRSDQQKPNKLDSTKDNTFKPRVPPSTPSAD